MNEFWGWVNAQLGNILGVVGVITGFWFYWISRKPKRFGWQVTSKVQIINFKGQSLPLKVVYDGHDVYSPNIIVFRVGNSGKAPILREDYDGPVRITFTKGRLLAADVSKKFDETIDVNLMRDSQNSVSFTPSLLNAGEWVEFQFVTDGPIEIPKLHARIAGLDGRPGDVEARRTRFWLPIALCGVIASLVVPIVVVRMLPDEWRTLASGTFIPLMAFAFYALTRTSGTPTWAVDEATRLRKRRRNKKKAKVLAE